MSSKEEVTCSSEKGKKKEIHGDKATKKGLWRRAPRSEGDF